MGNSPSKNDPLPKSSSSNKSSNGTASSSTTTSGTDLDPDEMAPALSQLIINSHLTTNSTVDTDSSNNNNNRQTRNTNNGLKQETSMLSTSMITTTATAPQRIPSTKRKLYASQESYDFDLEIGMSMAKLLKNQELTSLGSLKASPVFTTISNDEDLLFLSTNSSPRDPKSNKQYIDNVAPLNKLDVIAEIHSLESSPTPKTTTSKLSKKNLKKYDKSVAKQLTKKNPSSTSSLLDSPPLVGTTHKLDIDIDAVIERLLATKKKSTSRKSKSHLPVETSEIKYILSKSRLIFLEQPTLLKLSPPVKIVGDIHGQFHDLIRIFNCCGYPPHSNYLFLGDYVDRGEKSLETILLLLCYKIKYPENFFMLRGNHESANITKIYGFYDECKRRLGNNKLWRSFIDVFNTLPIAAVINEKIFCVHGGLSPQLENFRQIEDIKRPTDVPDKGLLADLLWSDPDALVKNFSLTNWPKNDRGVSYCFGKKHVDYFCSKFKLDLIVRGHMVVEDGYEFFNKRKLVTVFSAPNYCGEFNNFGAIMSVDKTLYCSFELIKPN